MTTVLKAAAVVCLLVPVRGAAADDDTVAMRLRARAVSVIVPGRRELTRAIVNTKGNNASVQFIVNEIPTVRWLRVSGREVTPQGLTLLAKLPLEDLYLTYPIADDSLAAVLAEHAPQLRRLRISKAQMTAAGYKSLSRLQHLQSLTLGTSSTIGGTVDLRGLAELPALEQLDLSRLKIGPQTAIKLPDSTTLKELRLKYAAAAVDVYSLPELPQLESLTMHRHSGVNDEVVAQIVARCPRLTQLGLNETRITNEGCAALAKLSSLRNLSLAGTAVTDAGVERLAALPLESLRLDHTAITDRAASSLAGFDHLKYLNISQTQVSEQAERYLKGRYPDAVIAANAAARRLPAAAPPKSIQLRILPAGQPGAAPKCAKPK